MSTFSVTRREFQELFTRLSDFQLFIEMFECRREDDVHTLRLRAKELHYDVEDFKADIGYEDDEIHKE